MTYVINIPHFDDDRQWLITLVINTLRVMTSSTDKLYKEIANRIVKSRKAKGMSQERLAAESGIDRSHIGFIEQGLRKPNVATLYKITKSLDISLEQLFKGL